MKRRDLFSLAAAVGAGSLVSGCASTVKPAAPLPARTTWPAAEETATPLAGMAGRLFDKLVRKGNVVFSPWSIAMVLSMVREGALGATGAELDALLGGSAPGFGNDLAAGSEMMLSAGDRLHVGNSLWGQDGLAWQRAFLDRLEGIYGAPLRLTDFTAAPEAARIDINAWVKKQTVGKIPELITPGLIDDATRLVLVNALHFKAPWATPMIDGGKLPFTTDEGRKVVRVPTLRGHGSWPWLSNKGLSGTAIPCEGGDFALVVVLQEDATSSTPISPTMFTDVLDAPVKPVSVQLPAWKFRLKVRLDDLLKELGVKLAFDPNQADFSAMTADARLFLAFVVHEALIEVNAHGIEAAAATAGGMNVTSALVDPESLTLDRPFTWALMSVPTRTPLFIGRVDDPTGEQSE